MRKVWISKLFAEKIAQGKAREALACERFRFFGFSKRLVNGCQFFHSTQLFGSGLQTQRQQLFGLFSFASARLQFRKTDCGRGPKGGQPQSIAVNLSRLLLQLEPLLRNSK